MYKNFNRGFTLIELLVVIAIIGIFATIVLASLSDSRKKGGDAGVKSNLNNARAKAENYYYDNSYSYLNVCNIASSNGIYKLYQAAISAGQSTNAACNSNANAWAISVMLKSSSNYWCVDSTGISSKKVNPLGVATVCPGI